MFKKRLAGILLAFMTLPPLVQAVEISSPDDLFSSESHLTLELRYTEKLSKMLHPLIKKVFTAGMNSEEGEAMVEFYEGLLKNKDISVSFVPSDASMLMTIPVSADVANMLTQGESTEEYEGYKIYGEEPAFALIGEYYVMGSSAEALRGAIDRVTGKSKDTLSANAEYQKFVGSYLAPKFFNLTLNFSSVMEMMSGLISTEIPASEVEQFTAMLELYRLIKFVGINLAERSYGYEFQMKMQGDAEKLKEIGVGFDDIGSFTPNLYKKFPQAKPIFYSESFNAKAEYELSKKMLQSTLGLEMYEEISGSAALKEELGFDMERIYNVFDQEIAFGLQVDDQSVIPYFTVMANVSKTRTSARELLNEFIVALDPMFKKLPPQALTVNEDENFTFITLDTTIMHPSSPLGKIVITLGIDENGLFILSNYPDIQDTKKQMGFDSDLYFSTYAQQIKKNMGLDYFNARYLWDWLDKNLARFDSSHDLEFYRGYYFFLEKIYGFRDVFMTSEATETEVKISGKVTLDALKHKTFKQFLSEMKASDADGDGVSDYDERYVYFTPQDVADSDGDGISDFDEFKKGSNPRGQGKLFSDVPEGQYYSDAVGILYQQGTVKGYSDGTFQPGRPVNRAEFVSMVMNGLKGSTGDGRYREIDDLYTFSDVHAGDWYFGAVKQASLAGVIQGNTDSSGQRVFRPGDPITRAEALTILYRASKAFNPSSNPTSCSAVFEDVQTSDWFCDAVARGYENGITTGKEPKAFKPLDHITRAEAAVLIQRTLSRERILFESETPSFGDIFKEDIFESIENTVPGVI